MSQAWDQARNAPRRIARVVFVDAGLDIVFIVITVIVAFLVTRLAGMAMSGSDLSPVDRSNIAYAVPIATISTLLFACAIIRRRTSVREEPDSRSLLLAGLAGAILLASRSTWNGFALPVIDTAATGMILTLIVCVMAPVCEETFFRFYLWSKLKSRGHHDLTVLITTALLYVIPHMPTSLAAFGDYLTIGLFLGAVRLLSGGIVLSIFFHIAMNSILIFGL